MAICRYQRRSGENACPRKDTLFAGNKRQSRPLAANCSTTKTKVPTIAELVGRSCFPPMRSSIPGQAGRAFSNPFPIPQSKRHPIIRSEW